MKKLRVFLLAAGLVVASAGSSLAEGFALYEWSARGVALGGAVMARTPDASTVAYNPAMLTKLSGVRLQGGFSAITPDGKMSTTENGVTQTTNLKPSTWVVPHVYYTQQLSDRWFIGVGEFSRFGLGFEYPHNWPGRFNVYEVKLNSASINPNIAWKATDKLSLAAGVEAVYVKMDLKKRVGGLPNPAWEIDSNIQDAEDVGLGFNLAAHYQFNDQWAAGLSYRSQAKVRAWGDVEFSDVYGTINPAFYNMAVKDGSAHAEVVLPDSIAGGVSFTPIPELSFEVGATWTRWSTFRSLRIHLPDTPLAPSDNISDSKKMWDDSWRLSAGVEWQALDWLALRAGYVWDQSPMTEQYEDYLVPTDGRNIYSVGVGFRHNAWTLDLAYAYIDAKGRSYAGDPNTHVLDSKAKDTRTDLASITLGYEF